MTEETLGLLRQAFAVDATIEEACFYAGIHPSTYYGWKKENPEYFEEIERLRLTPILKARQTIVNGLNGFSGATWFIERKRRDEFATMSKVDHSGKIDTAHTGDTDAVRALALEYEDKLKAAIVESREKKPS